MPSPKMRLLDRCLPPASTLRLPTTSPRPPLRTQATTAVSSIDIHTQTHPDGSRDHFSSSSVHPASADKKGSNGGVDRYLSRSGSEAGDSSSVRSYAPTISAVGDVESLLGEVLNGGQSPAWNFLGGHRETGDPFEVVSSEDQDFEATFAREFDDLPVLDQSSGNEGT